MKSKEQVSGKVEPYRALLLSLSHLLIEWTMKWKRFRSRSQTLDMRILIKIKTQFKFQSLIRVRSNLVKLLEAKSQAWKILKVDLTHTTILWEEKRIC
jgi:hypothetical protein